MGKGISGFSSMAPSYKSRIEISRLEQNVNNLSVRGARV